MSFRGSRWEDLCGLLDHIFILISFSYHLLSFCRQSGYFSLRSYVLVKSYSPSLAVKQYFTFKHMTTMLLTTVCAAYWCTCRYAPSLLQIYWTKMQNGG